MPRKKRIWLPNSFYHVVCRGNRRDALFKDVGDMKTFLHMFEEVRKKTRFELVSYCLMTNHYHLQIRSQKQPLSKVMSLINKRYADYYNTKNRLTGHVFEKRYYGKTIDSKQGMLEVSRYIHLNPFEAKMVKNAESYPWSSYCFYLGGSTPSILNTRLILAYFSGDEGEKRRKYREYVEEGVN